MLILALAALAHAHDLEVHVTVPGNEPVFVTVPDVQPGTRHQFEFPASDGKTTYALVADVHPATDPSVWEIAFDLSSFRERGRGRRVDTETLARPTMRSRTSELASVLAGTTSPLVGATPGMQVFHGYSISWIVSPAPSDDAKE